MPLVALPDNRYVSFVKDPGIIMPRNLPAKHDRAYEQPPLTSSVLIILSAKAFSSVGFGLSVLAIWFSWALPIGVLPTAPPITESTATRLRKGHRRTRSVGSTPKKAHSRRLSAPVPVPPAPIHGVLETVSQSNSNRRVSFVDTHSQRTRRESAPTDAAVVTETPLASPPPDSQLFSSTATNSPLSSTSSLPSPVPLPTPPPERAIPLPSETSRPSAAPCQGRASSPVFRKLRLTFHSKRKTVQCESPPTPNQPLLEPPATPNKKPKPFLPPWSNNKRSCPIDPFASLETVSTRSCCSVSRQSTSSKASTNSSTSTSSFALLSKKSQRRISTPIPRTMPYGAPYFATPPLPLDDSYPAYLRRLPQFEEDMVTLVPSDSPDTSRGRDLKCPDSGPPPTRNIPKRRSASEDWSPRLGISVP